MFFSVDNIFLIGIEGGFKTYFAADFKGEFKFLLRFFFDCVYIFRPKEAVFGFIPFDNDLFRYIFVKYF